MKTLRLFSAVAAVMATLLPVGTVIAQEQDRKDVGYGIDISKSFINSADMPDSIAFGLLSMLLDKIDRNSMGGDRHERMSLYLSSLIDSKEADTTALLLRILPASKQVVANIDVVGAGVVCSAELSSLSNEQLIDLADAEDDAIEAEYNERYLEAKGNLSTANQELLSQALHALKLRSGYFRTDNTVVHSHNPELLRAKFIESCIY